jgi:hypothetical protein
MLDSEAKDNKFASRSLSLQPYRDTLAISCIWPSLLRTMSMPAPTSPQDQKKYRWNNWRMEMKKQNGHQRKGGHQELL